MNEKIRWLKLTRAEVSEKMREQGVKISRNIVRKLMKKHKFVKRRMQRKRSIGKSADREEQFKNIIGKNEYPKAKEILIFCDAGGANSYRHNIFKVELQKLVDVINIPIRIVHYPPYTSKWNPIEHRVFPHITKALEGVPLNTMDDVKNKIESTKTKTGLAIVADVIEKTYTKGKEVAKDFMDPLKIKFGDSLPRLNYTILPAGEN
jgi:hypothetical protein